MKKTNEDSGKSVTLKWRLQKQLTFEEVKELLALGVINEAEAKQLLFNLDDSTEKIKALEEQIKFLQGVVDKLSTRQPLQTVIKYVEDWRPHYYRPNVVWMNAGGNLRSTLTKTNTTTNAFYAGDSYGGVELAHNVMSTLKENSGKNIE